MVIKVYVSGICGSQEVRKQQQRVLFILQSMPIELEIIDVTEPGREEDRCFMQEECKKGNKKDPLPPQIFNDNEYCGDYADFQLANDDDEVMRFLKLEKNDQNIGDATVTNGLIHPDLQPDVPMKQEGNSNEGGVQGEILDGENASEVVDSNQMAFENTSENISVGERQAGTPEDEGSEEESE